MRQPQKVAGMVRPYWVTAQVRQVNFWWALKGVLLHRGCFKNDEQNLKS